MTWQTGQPGQTEEQERRQKGVIKYKPSESDSRQEGNIRHPWPPFKGIHWLERENLKSHRPKSEW